MNNNNLLFSTQEEQEIVNAIKRAEKNTSGEIRVHIDSESSEDHYKTAVSVFNQLQMYKTKNRNGVLFHISPSDKNVTLIGDHGIDENTLDYFWDNITQTVINHFKKEEFKIGLIKGIEMVGNALKEHFPYQKDDKNELPDEISRS